MFAFWRGTGERREAEEEADKYGGRVFLSPRSRTEIWSYGEDGAENGVDGEKLGQVQQSGSFIGNYQRLLQDPPTINKFSTQMSGAYGKCVVAARMAGLEEVERSYRRKSLEAAAAISKIWERNMIKDKQERAKKMADLKDMMELLGI